MNRKVKLNLTCKAKATITRKCTAMQSDANSLLISYNFHVMLLLVNTMVPSELCQ